MNDTVKFKAEAIARLDKFLENNEIRAELLLIASKHNISAEQLHSILTELIRDLKN